MLGREGYALVADADRQGISPGSATLRELLSRAAPCLILIDEWVTYIRQVYSSNDLLGGSFDTNISFAQALTELVKATPRTLLVGSLPSSAVEAGGQGGAGALERLRSVFGRLESPWSPAGKKRASRLYGDGFSSRLLIPRLLQHAMPWQKPLQITIERNNRNSLHSAAKLIMSDASNRPIPFIQNFLIAFITIGLAWKSSSAHVESCA